MELLRGVVGIFLMLGTALALCEQALPPRRRDAPFPIALEEKLFVYQQFP
jgi:cytochrome c oxidase assembly factor CtaG